MKIKLLIATADSDYAEHLSGHLAEKYGETFEVSVCSSSERLRDLMATNTYDAALVEADFVSRNNLTAIRLPLVLVDETGASKESVSMLKKVRKYQRISAIAGNVLEQYAEIGGEASYYSSSKARITAVWSPTGGSGKTTVALALAAQRVSGGRQAAYLCLENFSSTGVYFQENGKSISKVFEKLDANVQMFLLGVQQTDVGSGITYFCGPENYDDMNILTESDLEVLIRACAFGTEDLIVDLSSQCDKRVQRVFELADTVLLVNDASSASQVKLRQFVAQHSVFGQIREKVVLVNNKGAKSDGTLCGKTVHLPLVQIADPISVFKTVSSGKFDW
jgi:MinD-like ATPase involved in chromosome partitioning or flagellar assembly